MSKARTEAVCLSLRLTASPQFPRVMPPIWVVLLQGKSGNGFEIWRRESSCFLIFIFLKSCDYLVRSGSEGPSSPIENVENKVHSGC